METGAKQGHTVIEDTPVPSISVHVSTVSCIAASIASTSSSAARRPSSVVAWVGTELATE